MGIRFYCPNGHKLNVKSFLAGKRGVCPHCNASVMIPLESQIESGARRHAAMSSTTERSPVDASGPVGAMPALPDRDSAPRFDASAPAYDPSSAAVQQPVASGYSAGGTSEPNSAAAPYAANGTSGLAATPPSPASPTVPTPDAGGPFPVPQPASTAISASPTSPAISAGAPGGVDLAGQVSPPSVPGGTTGMPTGAAPGPAATFPSPSAAPMPASPHAFPATSDHPGAVGVPGGNDPIAESPDAVWYVRPPSGGQFGPARGDIMRKWIAEGRVTSDSMVWRDGWDDWKEAGPVFPDLPSPPAVSSTSSPPDAGTDLFSSSPSSDSAVPRNVPTGRRKSSTGFAIATVATLVLVSLVLLVTLVWVLTSQS